MRYSRRRACGYGNRIKLCFPSRRSLELARKLVQCVTPLCTVTKIQVDAQRVYGDVVVPLGPLPEGEGIAGAMLPCPTPLHVEQLTCVVSAITPAQRLRYVIDDSVSLIQPCVDHSDAFTSACGLASVMEQAGVLRALMRAEVSVTLNFGITAAVQ